VEGERMKRDQVRYSEAFKLRVVSELETGRVVSQNEARERYGIGGSSTISKWIRKYGKNDLAAKVIRVETSKDRDAMKALKKRIRELEKAVADAKVQEVLHKAYFEIVCERYGVTDPEELKKKLATTLLGGECGLAEGSKGST
jgi:transposase-like protein